MENDNTINEGFENHEADLCFPECLDLEQPISLSLTPVQIIQGCFHNGDSFHLSTEPNLIYPPVEVRTILLSVEAENGSCQLYYEEGYYVKPGENTFSRHAIDLDFGTLHVWSIYYHDELEIFRPAHYAALAEEDFIRACTLLGEKVTYRPVHHRLTEE